MPRPLGPRELALRAMREERALTDSVRKKAKRVEQAKVKIRSIDARKKKC